jgi:hypothetical protein
MNSRRNGSFSLKFTDVLLKLLGGLCDQLNYSGIVRQSGDLAHVHQAAFHTFYVERVHVRKTNVGLRTFPCAERIGSLRPKTGIGYSAHAGGSGQKLAQVTIFGHLELFHDALASLAVTWLGCS